LRYCCNKCEEVEDFSKKALVRCEPSGLKNHFDRYKTVFKTIFWNLILKHFNSTNKQRKEKNKDQKVNINLRKVVKCHQFLEDFFNIDLR